MTDTSGWSEKDKHACEQIRKSIAEYDAPSVSVLAAVSMKVVDAYVDYINDKNTVRHGRIRRWMTKHGW